MPDSDLVFWLNFGSVFSRYGDCLCAWQPEILLKYWYLSVKPHGFYIPQVIFLASCEPCRSRLVFWHDRCWHSFRHHGPKRPGFCGSPVRSVQSVIFPKVQHQELKADYFSSSNAMISIELRVLYQLLIAGCLDCDVIAFYCLFVKYHIASYRGKNRVCGS
jgi:hypothetical protein